jgi:hypothetical protein
MSKPLDDSNIRPHDPVLAALAACSPTPPQLDRDRLMFLAGRASVHPVPSTQYSVLSTEPAEQTVDRPPHITEYPVLSTQYLAPGAATRLWRSVAAVLAATSVGLAVALFTRTPPKPQVVVVRQTQPQIPKTVIIAAKSNELAPSIYRPSLATHEALPRENYLRTREVAFRMGLDALGSTTITGEPFVPTYADLMRGLNQSSQAEPSTAALGRPLSNM